MFRRLTIAVGLLSCSLLGACDKPAPPPPAGPPVPTERRPLVASEEAPFLSEAEDDEPAASVARAGEVVEVLRELGNLKWEAGLGDRTGKREGRLVEVRQAPESAILFGWKSDIGPEVDVPTAKGICEAIARDPAVPDAAKRPSCAGLLRRVRLPDGAFAAYHVCTVGPCPVALVRDGQVRTTIVEGMHMARMMASPSGSILLASTRWVRSDGAWTGGSFVPVKLGGPAPVVLAAIPADEVDARDATKVVTRAVKVALEATPPASLHVFGERSETARADGRKLASAPIDERSPVGDR
jgi:hypothetical protein